MRKFTVAALALAVFPTLTSLAHAGDSRPSRYGPGGVIVEYSPPPPRDVAPAPLPYVSPTPRPAPYTPPIPFSGRWRATSAR